MIEKTGWLIQAGTTITPTRTLHQSLIEIVGGKFKRVIPQSFHRGTSTYSKQGFQDLDASDAIVIPGLVDLQVNGGLGWSFQAADSNKWRQILDYHLFSGTTTLLPTLITAPKDVLLTSLICLADYLPCCTNPTLPGIHLEGPFLSPERSGAHDPMALSNPSVEYFGQLIDAAKSNLVMLTLAPELPGAEAVIRQAVQVGMVVSAGHSAASYQTIQAAYQAGLRFVTHAGNASDWPHREMGEYGFLSSEPGLVGSLMAIPNLGGSLIMDGHHFHPALLPPLLAIKGVKNLALISDASPVAGCPPGEYQSGGLVVTIHPEGFATSGRGGGWLAGSTITLLQAVQRAVNLAGLSLQQAVEMATLTPARWIRIEQKKGQIRNGWDADLLVLNQDLSLRHVISGGVQIQ